MFCSDRSTWHGRLSHRMLDYFFTHQPHQQKDAFIDHKLLHLEEPAKALRNDHDLVVLKVFLLQHGLTRSTRSRRHSKCRKWAVARDKLQGFDIDIEWFKQQSVAGQWEVLQHLSSFCSYPRPSYKYKDPPAIKQLCRERHLMTDPAVRADLARQIVGARREARHEWLAQLMHRASDGDCGAVSYLKARAKPVTTHEKYIEKFGGKQAAARDLKTRMKSLFEAPERERDKDHAQQWEIQLTDAANNVPMENFWDTEILQGVSRLKKGKTSGKSGVSADFLHALVSLPSGVQMIRAHLNSLLREGRAPDDYYEAFVCLLAKCPEISRAKDCRPINLLETMHKLFLSLLTKRMEDATPHFPCQYAGRPGSQTLDALTAAYNMVDRESKWGVSSIWLSLDVSAAFDSLKLSEVGAFFMEEVGPHRAWEALRMFQFMGKGVLDFQNLQEQWSIRQTCGVQQGGSHSSWVFSCVLARRLQQLFERWRRDAPASLHSCFGILYVDDILICLPSWLHADPMFNALQEVLSSMGLTINMDKTQLMATSDMLHAGKQQLSATSPLCELTWDTSATHLRWKLQHTDHSSSLILQAQSYMEPVNKWSPL